MQINPIHGYHIEAHFAIECTTRTGRKKFWIFPLQCILVSVSCDSHKKQPFP